MNCLTSSSVVFCYSKVSTTEIDGAEQGAILRGAGTGRSDRNLDPSVLTALVVDLDDPRRTGPPGGDKMRPAAGLTIEIENLDDAHETILSDRRSDGLAAEQAGDGLRFAVRHEGSAHRKVPRADDLEAQAGRSAREPAVTGEIGVTCDAAVLVGTLRGDERRMKGGFRMYSA